MKNLVQVGDTLDLTAPSGGVTGGVGYVIGSNTFVVAESTVAAGLTFQGRRTGVVRLPKATGSSTAITAGNNVWWDNTAKNVRHATGTGRFPIGMAVAAAGDDATEVLVILTGVSTVAAS